MPGAGKAPDVYPYNILGAGKAPDFYPYNILGAEKAPGLSFLGGMGADCMSKRQEDCHVVVVMSIMSSSFKKIGLDV